MSGGKGVSRRQMLGKLAAATAGVAAASLLPNLKLVDLASSPAAPAGSKGEGFALVSDASHFGKVIRWSPAGVAEAATDGSAPDSNNRTRPPYSVSAEHQWVMVIDLEKCDGCRECQKACDKYHHVPPGQEWIKVYEMKEERTGDSYFTPRVCNQCDNPPCVKVCPVGASFKREDGIVLIDQDRCIGCRFCIAACPYSARYFTWSEPPQTAAEKAQPYDIQMNTPHRKGVAEKCLFCPELLEQGKLPSCSAACPMGAIYFGDKNEDAVTNSSGETLKLSAALGEGAYNLQEELGTRPRVFYLPARRRKYPGPKESRPTAAGKGA